MEPIVWTRELPGIGGAIGPSPEDFVVDEVPLYAPCGTGEHLYVRIRKRSRTTRDLVRAVANAADVSASEVGSAGMKDKHAVTTQWVSLPAKRAREPEAWSLPDGLELLETSRHTNKLRTGHLSGNRFRIRLLGVDRDAEGMSRDILQRIAEHGLPNFFGAQRFGARGDNLDAALSWAKSPQSKRIPPFEQKLFSSVIQSEVFNRYAMARLVERLDAPLTGEVVRLSGSKALFAVEDPDRETDRWRARDIHPTGPIFGPKMKGPRGRPLELEKAALEALDLRDEVLARLGRVADGTRRDLFVTPTEVETASDGPRCLVISFFLPSGSYATCLVRELTRAPFLGDAR
jgi:tRNA pseudouridine13 synthase